MKKFFILLVLIAASFFVSCGSDDEEEAGASCATPDALKCSSPTMVQKCNKETLVWTDFQTCKPDQVCKEGKCEAKTDGNDDNTGGDSGSTGGDSGGDTGGDTGADSGNSGGDTGGDTGGDAGGSTGGDTGGSTGGAGDSCIDIYSCFAECKDRACQEACVAKGSPEGQQKFNAFYGCLEQNCANVATEEEFAECAEEKCEQQMVDCGFAISQPGDDSYAVPYGKANIVIKSTYLVTTEKQLGDNMVVMTPFASGTFGTAGNLEVSAPGAMQVYFSAQTEDGKSIAIQQQAQNQQQQPLNPWAELDINKAKLTTGAISVGPTQNDAAQFAVFDLTPDGKKISCLHAVGKGSLQVISAKLDPGAGANIEIKGELDLYSPKNWPDFGGDISGQLGAPACPAQ